MSNFTPGPWIVEAPYFSEVQTMERESVASCWHSDCNGKSVTISGVIECSPEESAANARLIAAAPDLLEALKDAVCALDCCGKDYPAAEKAREAIAKATGQ